MIWSGKSLLGKWNSTCQGPEVRGWPCSRRVERPEKSKGEGRSGQGTEVPKEELSHGPDMAVGMPGRTGGGGRL